MLTQNETIAAVNDVFEDRARLAAKLVETENKIMAVYKRFGDKLGCAPNYVDVDKAIDAVIAENKRLVAELGTVG
jgi:hypothetical protein